MCLSVATTVTASDCQTASGQIPGDELKQGYRWLWTERVSKKKGFKTSVGNIITGPATCFLAVTTLPSSNHEIFNVELIQDSTTSVHGRSSYVSLTIYNSWSVRHCRVSTKTDIYVVTQRNHVRTHFTHIHVRANVSQYISATRVNSAWPSLPGSAQ